MAGKIRRRRALLLVIWIWLLCEAGAWATVRTLEGQAISQAMLRSRQVSLADQELRARNAGLDARKRTRADRGLEYRHPYLGFISKSAKERVHNIVRMMDPALGDQSSACFQEETFVVGIAGGSVAANLTHAYGAQLLRELEASPLLEGREVVLIVLANSGHKQPQALISYLFLDSLGVRFDAIMVLDGFNEIALHVGAAAKHKMLPVYPRQWVSRLGIGLAEGSLLARFDIEKANQADAAETVLESPLRRSWIRQLGWYRSNRVQDERIRILEEQLETSGEMDVERTGPPRDYTNQEEQFTDLVNIWTNSSRALFEMCAASGTLYLHFLQPNQYVAGSKPMGPKERGIALTPGGKYEKRVNKAYPMLQAAGAQLAAEGVLFHDLTDVFADVQQPLYVDDCCHVNGMGSTLMGTAMLEALLAAIR
ncbi:MAG: hypothetical protein ACI8QC_000516 [Planctomycetota bacterium]|jgi:hypothetical protein